MGQVAVFDGPWWPRATGAGAGTGQVTARAKRGTKFNKVYTFLPKDKEFAYITHLADEIQVLVQPKKNILIYNQKSKKM